MNKLNYLLLLGIIPIWGFAQQIVINPAPPPTGGYTPTYLVEEILIEGDCAQVDNITSPNNASANGLAFESFAYFEANGAPFPFEDGIVLASNNVNTIPNGPITGGAWQGDPDLAALNGQTSNNATVFEFDFVPFVNEISFQYIMASREYLSTSSFPCTFEDAFAFIISGPYDIDGNLITDDFEPGTPGVFQDSYPYNIDGNPNTDDVVINLGGLNIATLPGTNIPAFVTNIHNISCGAGSPGEFAAAQFFDAENSGNGAIAYDGQTVPLTASTEVIAGQIYKIKLAVADSRDTAFNSAVFIEGSSFTLGDIDLGDPITLEDEDAQCVGDVVLLDTDLPEDSEIVFEWYFGELGTNPNQLIEGEESPSLEVTETGSYAVFAFIPAPDGSIPECFNTGSTSVEFFDTPVAELEQPLLCADGIVELDATPDNLEDLLVQDPDGPSYIWFFEGEEIEGETDAVLEADMPGLYDVQITFNACNVALTSNVELVDFAVDLGEDEEICVEVEEQASFEIVPELIDVDESDDVAYLWNTGETSASITVNETGVYTLTTTIDGCDVVEEIEIVFIPVPDVSIDDVLICDGGLGTLDATPSNIDEINDIDPEEITYTWFQNEMLLEEETSPTLVVSETGFYSVEVSFFDCTTFAESEVIAENYFVDLGEAPTPCVQEGETPSFTIVSSVEGLDEAGLEQLEYLWSTGETTPSITVSESGTYSLTTTTVNGCEAFDEVSVQFSPAHVVSVADEVICFDEEELSIPSGYSFENADQIIWELPNGTEVENQANLSLTWNAAAGASAAEGEIVGDYFLTVIIAGCEVTTSFEVDFFRQSPSEGTSPNSIIESCTLPQGISPNGDGINDCFDLSFLAMEPGIEKLQIFNRYGRKVFESTDYVNEFCGQDDGGNFLVTGTYFYVLELNEAALGFDKVEKGWVYINREQQ